MTRLAVDTTAEHNWHDCTTPTVVLPHPWNCPVCDQRWIWRRPPRPPAQWIRADAEQAG